MFKRSSILFISDGSIYEGAWRHGLKHGQGVYAYVNGDVYVGSFFTGKKHGSGRYSSKLTGAKYAGKKYLYEYKDAYTSV